MNKNKTDKQLLKSDLPGVQRRSLRLLTFSELKELPKTQRLAGPLFPQPGLTAAFGPPKSGKTFVVLDAVCRISTGKTWHDGSPVVQGDAVWVASEGQWGLDARGDSWIFANGQDLPDNLRFLLEPVNLFVGEPSDLVAEIERLGLNPTIVVFDSLAGCSVGANESSPGDRQQTIDAANALIRRYRCNVTVIHHTTKDGLSERGTNALRAAADQMFRIDKSGDQVKLRSEAERDAAPFDPLNLELVEVGESLVVRASERPNGNVRSRSGLGKRIEELLAAQPAIGWLSTVEIADELGVARSTLSRELQSLVKREIVEETKLESPGSPKAFRLRSQAKEDGNETIEADLCPTTHPLGGSGGTKAVGSAWTEGQFQ